MKTVTNYYQCCGHCGATEPYNCGAQHTEKCLADGCKQGVHVIKTVSKSADGKKTVGHTRAPYKEPVPAPAFKPSYGCCGACHEDCECSMWDCDCPPEPVVSCSNCDGIKCMNCRTRHWHDECEDDCPDCCTKPMKPGKVTLKDYFPEPTAFTPNFLEEPPAATIPAGQSTPELSPEKRELLDLLMGKPANDPVNHPKHYTDHPSGVECIQITEWMGFNLGNATKYICELTSRVMTYRTWRRHPGISGAKSSAASRNR